MQDKEVFVIVPDYHRLRRLLYQRLSEERYYHSLCVERRAAQLAVLHGSDWQRASLAGLLHDIWHCGTPDEQLKYLRARGILLDDFSLQHPAIWHAICGEVYLRELGVGDEQVLSAVRWHTTGRAAMTTLEQVVFLADATSDDRDYPSVTFVRELADRSLDQAMLYHMQYTLGMLVTQGRTIVCDALEAYNYYADLCGGASWPAIQLQKDLSGQG